MPRGVSLYDEAQLQGRLFDPLRHCPVPPTVYLNFNRRDAVTLDASSTVTRLRNLGTLGASGDAVRATPNSTLQPTIATLNGSRRVGDFVAANKVGLPASASGLSGNSFTIIGLARIKPGGTAARIFAGNTGNYLFNWWTNKKSSWFNNNAFVCGGSGGPADDNTWQVFMARGTAGVPSFRNNGSLVTTSGSSGNGPADFFLGGWNDANGEFSDCQIFACGLWPASLPDMTVQQVEGALMWEAGLVANLAASHSCKNRPPLIGG